MVKKEKKTNLLSDWNRIIDESAKQSQEARAKWQKEIGEPDQIIEIVDYKFDDETVTHKVGFWKIKEGVLVIQFDKRGPNPAMQQVFTLEFIDKLVKTSRKINYKNLLLKYMDEVIVEEGISFVPKVITCSYIDFTQEELDALKEIETILKEAARKRKLEK